MQRKLALGRERSRANVVQMDIDGTPPFLRSSEAALRPHGQDTLSDTIGNSTCTSATRRFRHFHGHSVKDWEEGTTLEFLSVIPEPGGTKGAYFTSTRTRRYQDRPNPQGRLLAERNPKLNGVSEAEFLGWKRRRRRRKRRKGGVATDVRVQAYPRSLEWTVVVAEGRGEIRINGQVDK